MSNINEQFSCWKIQLQNNNYDTVYLNFQKLLNDHKLCHTDCALLASRCLRLINIKSQETLKNNSVDCSFLKNLFLLAELCCQSISKSLKSTAIDFISSVFYICKLLLSQNYIKEAVIIGQFAFNYTDEHDNIETLNKDNNVDVSAAFLLIFLNAIEKSSNEDDIFSMWDLILSSSGWRIKRTSISKMTEYFSSFVYKMTKHKFRETSSELIPLLKLLSRRISEAEDSERIFLKLLRSIVYRMCEFSSEENQFFFIEFLLEFLNRCESTAVRFCEHIVRIISRVFANETVTQVIRESNQKLQMLLKTKSPTLNDAVYLAVTIIVKKRLLVVKDCPPDVSCASDFFELLLTLAQQFHEIDLNDLFYGKRKEAERKDIASAAFLAGDVMFVANFLNDSRQMNLKAVNIYESILKSEKLLLQYLVECNTIDKKKRQQVLQTAGANCVNISRAYMKPGHYAQCKELSLNALLCFSSLPAIELSDPFFKTCLEKLVICLCTSYRELELYKNSLVTSLSWIFISPTSANAFIDLFCIFKNKFTSVDAKMSCLDLTCIDVLTTENQWKLNESHECDLAEIVLMEMMAYVKYSINMARPVMKLLAFVGTLKLLPVKKAEYYCAAARILANSADNLKDALRILRSIESLIREIEGGYDLTSADDKHYIILGNLHYAKFRIKLLATRDENEAEVKLLELAKPMTIQPDAAKETYDFVTASYTFSSQKEILTVLNKAVKYWHKAVSEIENSDGPSKLPTNLELSHLKEVALLYRLYCDSAREIKTWQLLYTVAKYGEQAEMTIYAISNLMCTLGEMNPSWEKEVKELMPQVSEKIKLTYRLAYLNRCYERGLKPEDISMLMDITPNLTKQHLLLAKYYFLMARCHFTRSIDFSRDPYAMSFRAYNIIMHAIVGVQWTNFVETCELQCLLFDVVLFMISCDVTKYEFCTAKLYLKETFSLIQKLGLSLRTCQFLNVSARLDTITGNLEECYVKLSHVCRILDRRIKTVAVTPFPVTTSPDVLSDLRCMPSNYDFDFENMAVFHSEVKFQMPDFAQHQADCRCDMCENHEYLQLSCQVMALFAVYFGLMNKLEAANEYFEGVFKLLKVVEKRCQTKEMKVMSLIQYGNYWAARGHLKEAEKCNKKAFELLAQIQNPALVEKCEEQMLQLMRANLVKEEPNEVLKVKRTQIVSREPRTVSKAHAFKTPGKVAKATVCLYEDSEIVNSSQALAAADITPYPRRSRRALLFDENKTPMPTVKKATERKKRITKKTESDTPPDYVLDLPSTQNVNSNQAAAADITPYPRRSRRALLFDENKTLIPTVKKATERKKRITKKTESNTPPDYVLDLPSTLTRNKIK